MTIQLTKEGMRAMFPRAPMAVIDAFVSKQAVLDKAGITHTRPRLTDFFANIGHEVGGFTIKGLIENIWAYTHARMAQVWPNRFSGGGAVAAAFGSGPGWHEKAFDSIYGGRMGNRKGTNDGSRFIGRGGPQWTGRDGYEACKRITGLDVVTTPDLACRLDLQPEVSAAFWTWKNLSRYADVGNWIGLVKAWNGGTNGLADRNAYRARIAVIAKTLPGAPPTAKPPKEVIDDATTTERRTRTGGAASTGTGAGVEVGKTTGTIQPDNPVATPYVTWTLIGMGVAVILVATFLIVRKKRAVISNWF